MKKYTTVAEFMDDLDGAKRKQVVVLRKSILAVGPVTERIKWNAPSYVYNDEDRVTFNMHGENIRILIHMGATTPEDKNGQPILDDPAGLVEWNSNIRGTITFTGIEDILTKQQDFEDLIRRWFLIAA